MRIKTLLLTLVFGGALVIGGIAHAQDTLHRPMLTRKQMIEKRLAHLSHALKLTDAQKSQLKAMWLQNAATIKADRQAIRNAAPGSQARKDAIKQLRTDMRGQLQKMKTVLTPQQLQKFKHMQLRRIHRRQARLKRREQRLKK